jgi:hypothetical protein
MIAWVLASQEASELVKFTTMSSFISDLSSANYQVVPKNERLSSEQREESLVLNTN